MCAIDSMSISGLEGLPVGHSRVFETEDDQPTGTGVQPLGRRAALIAGATTLGAVALGSRLAFASGGSFVLTDPLTNNTCILPSGDITGKTDATNINQALAANLNGQNVVLAAGRFYVNAPIIIPPGGVLKGQFANENTRLSNHAWGSCISAVATWAPTSVPGGAVNAVLACVGANAGGYPTPGQESKVYGVMIDCAQLPRSLTNVDGLQIFGDMSRPHLERVLVAYAPQHGFNMVNDSTGSGPDAAHLERVNVRYPTRVGFNHIRISDCTYYDCLCENAGGDGFYIQNGSNSVWTACRSEHNGGNGYTYDCTNPNTGSGGVRLVGCSSDRNEAHGIFITSTNGSGVPLVLSGCAFRRDGAQKNAGGGPFAGITVSLYPGSVLVSGCNVWPGVDDNSHGVPSPNHGMRLFQNTSRTRVIVGSSYIQGAKDFLSDDGTTPDVRWGTDVVGAFGTTSSPTLRQPRMGHAVLSGGSARVDCSCVNENSIIQLTHGFTNGGTPGILRVSVRTPGSSFVVTSSSSNDQSGFDWQIMNP